MEERRNTSLEQMLIAMGKLEQITSDTNRTVSELSTKVGIQNGRVGNLEKWQAFIQGAVAIIIVLIIPVVLKVVTEIFQKGILQ